MDAGRNGDIDTCSLQPSAVFADTSGRLVGIYTWAYIHAYENHLPILSLTI